jgi:hypothetical protein
MTPRRRVALYLRDSVPNVARIEQQTAVGRLRALEAAGIVDEVTIEQWPSRVSGGSAATVPALAAYDGFTTWAVANEASLRPAFDRHDCRNFYTGTEYITTVLPVLCLAVYEADRLRAVYPHVRRGPTTTVLDGIALLESETPIPVADRVSGRPHRPSVGDADERA